MLGALGNYLHLSCHANTRSMATTLDHIPFSDLAELLRGRLNDRRLFISASMASEELADALMPKSCGYSILGPSGDVGFGRATILWASLYHVMFAEEREAMKAEGSVTKVAPEYTRISLGWYII